MNDVTEDRTFLNQNESDRIGSFLTFSRSHIISCVLTKSLVKCSIKIKEALWCQVLFATAKTDNIQFGFPRGRIKKRHHAPKTDNNLLPKHRQPTEILRKSKLVCSSYISDDSFSLKRNFLFVFFVTVAFVHNETSESA